jgi:hypothetical protein
VTAVSVSTATAIQPTGEVVAASVALDGFKLRCWARATLVEHGMLFLQEAVDELQDLAVATGLVDLLGKDDVQAIMAASFEHRRSRTC